MAYPPLSGARLVWVTLALSMAVFMQVLDSTIANVALPTIAGDLGAATSQGTWVITSFAVANAISVPLTGWLAKRFGEVRVFLMSTTLFVVASFLCGISQTLPMLIAFRIMQGAVAGPMIPLSQSLLMAAYPPEKRPMALGLWSMVIIVAPIFGPILGGYISDNYHWGWIFFINIPIGFGAAFIAWRELKDRETAIIERPIDKIGLALLVIGVGALQMMLDRGKELDWFASPEIIVLAVITVVALSYLIVWEIDTPDPIVDLSLFRDRNFTVGVVTISLAFMVYMGTIILLPLVLQTQMAYTAIWAGLAAAPIGLFPIILSPIIGRFGHRMDMRVLVTLSFVIYAICFIWRSHFNAQMTFWDVFWPQLVQGLGMAMFFMPLTTITLSRMQLSQMAAASSLSNFIRILCGGIGASITTTLWECRAAMHHAQLAELMTPANPTFTGWLEQLHAIGMNDTQAHTLLNMLISQQSNILGSNEVFYASGVLFFFLVVLVWFAKPPFSSAGGAGGGAH